MERGVPLVAGIGTERARRSRWPARLDLAQSVSGLLLALFMWVHMAFVSSILLGKDAMWTVTKFFEGYFVFGRSYPWIVSIAVAMVIALRRRTRVCGAQVSYRLSPVHDLPRPHAEMRMKTRRYGSGRYARAFCVVLLASVHLYIMLTRPDRIVVRSSPQTGSGPIISGRCTSCSC
jgi:fumarate reductase subunit C